MRCIRFHRARRMPHRTLVVLPQVVRRRMPSRAARRWLAGWMRFAAAVGLGLFASSASGTAQGTYVHAGGLTGLFARAASAGMPAGAVGRIEPRNISVDISMTNNDYQSAALCAESCFAATFAFSTVPFFTFDTPKSVTLVYNGDRLHPRPFVYADVAPEYGSTDIREYSLEASVNGVGRTFLNGDTQLVFSGSNALVRLAGQFDATDLSTGVYPMTVTVKATYVDNAVIQKSIVTELMIVNEINSYVARGWTLAGLQRLYFPSSGGFMVTEGDGTAIRFTALLTPAADFTTIEYDGRKYLRRYPDGTRVTFNASGMAASIIDPLNFTTAFAYDGFNRLTRIDDPMSLLGNGAPHYTLVYDLNGLSEIREEGGIGASRVTAVSVSTGGALQSATDPDALSTTFSYDGNGRLATVTDRRGGLQQFTYAAPSWKVSSITLPQIPVDVGGGTTNNVFPVVQYSPWQQVGVPVGPTSSAAPAAPTFPIDVEATVVDPINRSTTIRVDRFGSPLMVIEPDGGTTAYTKRGILVTRVDRRDGGVDNFDFDAAGRLAMSHPSGNSPTYFGRGGPFGQVDTVYGAGARPESRRFDANGQVTDIYKFGSQFETYQFTYDALTKRVAWTRDPDLHQTTYAYDSRFGNLSQTTVAGGRNSSTGFDSHGRDSTMTSSGLATLVLQYDPMNRPTRQYDGVNPTPAILGYDQLFRTDVTDISGNNYHTDNNALGLPVRECDAVNACSTYRYNASGELTSSTNRRGQIVTLTRDILGRITSKSGTNTSTDNFSYSANMRDMVAWNAVSRDSIFVNPGSASTPASDSVVTWIAGKRFRTSHKQGMSVTRTDSVMLSSNTGVTFNPRLFNYSSAGKLESLSAGFGNTALGYNIEGFVSDVTYPSVPSIALTNTSLHNPRGRFYNSSSLGSVFGRNIHYDAAARIDQMTNPIAGTMQWAYGYDPLGRLTGREVRTACTLTSDDWSTGDGSGLGYSCPTLSATEGFSYDASGNRTDRGAVIVAGNRYQSFNNASQAYDADGNVIQKYDPSRFNRQFSWSAENRLDSIVQDGWSRVRYDYNAFGQPVRKWRGDPNSSYVDRIFLWDGEQLIAEFDGNGNRVTEYVYLPGSVDQPFAHVLGATTPSEIRYHQQDALGNVAGTIAGESVSQNNAYDSWGTPTISGNADSRLFWKGLMWEGDIVSLYYVRNRWYDPETGRFVSEDPIGHDGGLNLYAFGGNDPVNGQDPSGLCTADPSPWIDFTLRSAGQGTYTLTCRDLPPIIITASSGGFSKNFGNRGGSYCFCATGSNDVGARIGNLLRPFQGPAETLSNAVLFFGGGLEAQGAARITVAARQFPHIFRSAAGHVNPITISSRNRFVTLFENVANDIANRNDAILGPAARGVGMTGYSRIFARGQVWAHVINGRITNAGVNRPGAFR